MTHTLTTMKKAVEASVLTRVTDKRSRGIDGASDAVLRVLATMKEAQHHRFTVRRLSHHLDRGDRPSDRVIREALRYLEGYGLAEQRGLNRPAAFSYLSLERATEYAVQTEAEAHLTQQAEAMVEDLTARGVEVDRDGFHLMFTAPALAAMMKE